MRRARHGRLALAAALLALVASCAPPPRPESPSRPPPVSGVPVPRPTPPAAAPVPGRFELHEEPTIDVGLAWDLDTLSLQPIQTDGAGVQHAGASGVEPRGGGAHGVLTVRRSGDGARVQFAGLGSAFTLAPGDTLWTTLAPGAPNRDGRVRWNGRTWRGALKVFVNPRGRLTLATRLPLETYLCGVVPGEIGALDEKLLEAGRAQAVAARSYTLFYRGRRAAEGFDLYGTVEDQMYGSVEGERPLATRCVESTHGLLALFLGFPIRANYCSTCGGVTADVWEAWPAEGLPYLVGAADRGEHDWCAASPQYRWREEWSAAEFLANVTRFAPVQSVALPPGGLGELVDVRVESRSRSARVWRLRVVTTGGDVVVPAYSVRQVLRRGGNSAAILRSNLFKIDVRRDPATRRALAVVASGAGSGHGVGLCQTGALGMARAGKDADAILGHYYSGIEIRRLY